MPTRSRVCARFTAEPHRLTLLSLRRKKTPGKVFMAGTSAVVIAAAALYECDRMGCRRPAPDSLLAKAVRQEDAEASRGLRVHSGTENCLISPQWAVYDKTSNQTFCNTVSANLQSQDGDGTIFSRQKASSTGEHRSEKARLHP